MKKSNQKIKVNSSSCILSIEYLTHIRRRRRRRRLRRGQRLVKKSVSILLWNFAFIWNYPVCLSVLKLAPAEYTTDVFNSKVTCCGSRSPDNAEFSHYTLVFFRGRPRNAPRVIMHGITIVFLIIPSS